MSFFYCKKIVHCDGGAELPGNYTDLRVSDAAQKETQMKTGPNL